MRACLRVHAVLKGPKVSSNEVASTWMHTCTTKRPRGPKDEMLWDEEHHLLRMDPSLMTERQQLTFLLRTTAHETSDTLQ